MAENDVIDEMNETEEEEDTITCPVCGEDIEPGTENCPLCGAPVGALENNNISGTSIDNSAAIDAMLQSAAMLVEESASLGVAINDEEDDDDTDEEGLTVAGNYDEDPYPAQSVNNVAAPAPQPPTPSPSPVSDPPSIPDPEPVDEQESQTEADASSAPPPAKKTRASRKKSKRDKSAPPTLYAMDENGNPIPEEDDQEDESDTASSKKSAKPKKNKSKNKDKNKENKKAKEKVKAKAKEEVKVKEKNRKKDKDSGASPVLVVFTAIVALALGCAMGFFGKQMFFPDFVVPECQDFAERAVLGVNSVVDGNIYVAEAYVNESGDATQCVFRALTYGAGDSSQMRWFRVKVYNDAPDTVRIYFQLDMNRYNEMINSGDDEQRIQASLLMSNQQEMDRCISEIQSGAEDWNAANAAMLNDSLHFMPEESDNTP